VSGHERVQVRVRHVEQRLQGRVDLVDGPEGGGAHHHPAHGLLQGAAVVDRAHHRFVDVFAEAFADPVLAAPAPGAAARFQHREERLRRRGGDESLAAVISVCLFLFGLRYLMGLF